MTEFFSEIQKLHKFQAHFKRLVVLFSISFCLSFIKTVFWTAKMFEFRHNELFELFLNLKYHFQENISQTQIEWISLTALLENLKAYKVKMSLILAKI